MLGTWKRDHHLLPAVPAEHSKHSHLFKPLEAGLDRISRWLEKLAKDETVVRKKDYEQFEAVWSGGQVRLRAARAHVFIADNLLCHCTAPSVIVTGRRVCASALPLSSARETAAKLQLEPMQRRSCPWPKPCRSGGSWSRQAWTRRARSTCTSA